MKAQPRKVTTAPSQPSAPTQQVVQEQRPVLNHLNVNQILTIMKHFNATTRVRPTWQLLNKSSQLWNWDLRRDNISRPKLVN
ncbi:MAG: hypothetical protein ACLTNP_03350 [Streptococcus salivarius]